MSPPKRRRGPRPQAHPPEGVPRLSRGVHVTSRLGRDVFFVFIPALLAPEGVVIHKIVPLVGRMALDMPQPYVLPKSALELPPRMLRLRRE